MGAETQEILQDLKNIDVFVYQILQESCAKAAKGWLCFVGGAASVCRMLRNEAAENRLEMQRVV